MTTTEDNMNAHPQQLDDVPEQPNAIPHERKKLQLKPRSSLRSSSHRENRRRQSSSKGNPFGDAKPREEILQQRGIDVRSLDEQIERKAGIHKYTKSQEEELDKVRSELNEVTEQWRDANEKELPEETYRLAEEAKRKELNDLLHKFDEMNLITHQQQQQAEKKAAANNIKTAVDDEDGHHRNSSNRGSSSKWQQQQQQRPRHHYRQEGEYGDEDDDQRDPAFSSFHTSSRRSRGGGGSGRFQNYNNQHHNMSAEHA